MVKSANLITELLCPFLTKRFLIEGLAKSEVSSIKAEHLQWHVHYNGQEVVLGGSKGWFDSTKIEGLLSEQPISTIPRVGIPGGYIGIHPFWMILENFWRNLIKHNADEVRSNIDAGMPTKIHLEVTDREGTPFWKVELWSEIDVKASHHNVVDDTKQALANGIVDAVGKLIPEAWGTKEMLIAAACLSARPLTDVQYKAQEILRCEWRENYLAYGFDLLKPLRLFIIDEGPIDAAVKTTLATLGVYVAPASSCPPVIPTEYAIVPKDYVSQSTQGMRPIKSFYPEDAGELDIAGLVQEEVLTALLIRLEKRFAQRLTQPRQSTYFTICTPSPTDEILLSACSSDEEAHGQRLEVADCKTDRAKTTLDSGGFLVVFDRHGDLKENKDVFDEITNSSQAFWEPYGGGTYTANALQYPPQSDLGRCHYIWTLVTAAMLRVVVLDERIQQILDKKDANWNYGDSTNADTRIKPLDCLKQMRIYIPNRVDCSLEPPSEERIKAFLLRTKPHILTIHAGLLDKMGYKKAVLARDYLTDLSKSMDGEYNRIVVHSGRGIPVNVPERDVPFVGYTAVENWVTGQDLKSKYALVQELLAARGVVR